MKTFPIVFVTTLLIGGLFSCSEKEASGAGDTKLELTAPADQTIERGKTNPIAIMVDRHGFEGPVDIAFSGLPQGVTVPASGGIPAGDSSRDFVLTAAPEAALVQDHVVTVVASSRDMRVTQVFKLSVEAP